jgi:ATP-dependent Clp protease ATP-binding subunit ClpA
LFELFTEKAIRVITYAREESSLLGHTRIYPEHLLLGILRTSSSVSSRLLLSAGVRIEKLRERIPAIIAKRQEEDSSGSHFMFSSSAKKTLRTAWDSAKSIKAGYISPEHIFIALIDEDNVLTLSLLKEFGADPDKLRESVLKTIGKKASFSFHPEDTPKGEFKEGLFVSSLLSKEQSLVALLDKASQRTVEDNFEMIGTEQLFLSLLESKDSELCGLLEKEGITFDSFQEKLSQNSFRKTEYEERKYLFTPSSLKSVNLSYELTKEFGVSSVSPEHLVLGILKEKNGAACHVLEAMGINIESLFEKISKPIEKQKLVTLTIIRLAKEEARRLGHNVLGSEQILLGILGEGTCIAFGVLKNLGVTLNDARIESEKLTGYGTGYLNKEISFTSRAKKLLEIAWLNAKRNNLPRIESEHLLLAMIAVKDCMAMKVLENLGVDTVEIKQGILNAIEVKNKNLLIEDPPESF